MLKILLAMTFWCAVCGCLLQLILLTSETYPRPNATLAKDLAKLVGYGVLAFGFGYLAFAG
ncbi:MAG: hypothetical protein ACYDC1_11950 [Limisphaerales bacterium]